MCAGEVHRDHLRGDGAAGRNAIPEVIAANTAVLHNPPHAKLTFNISKISFNHEPFTQLDSCTVLVPRDRIRIVRGSPRKELI